MNIKGLCFQETQPFYRSGSKGFFLIFCSGSKGYFILSVSNFRQLNSRQLYNKLTINCEAKVMRISATG